MKGIFGHGMLLAVGNVAAIQPNKSATRSVKFNRQGHESEKGSARKKDYP